MKEVDWLMNSLNDALRDSSTFLKSRVRKNKLKRLWDVK
jgi:hypothetical protein